MLDSCGRDFLVCVGPDVSVCIFRRRDDPAVLVRAATVSRSWLRFILEKVGMQICPEVSNFTSAEEVSRSRSAKHVAESSHGVELVPRERDYRTYSYIGGSLVPNAKPSVDCILHYVGAPAPTIRNTIGSITGPPTGPAAGRTIPTCLRA